MWFDDKRGRNMASLQVEFKGNRITKIWSKQYNFTCFIVPKDSVVSSIPDFDSNMAVYFLIDSREGKKERRSLYIGKTSTGMSRFFNHKVAKDWWDKVIIFTAAEKVFDEGTILGLEELLINRYRDSNLYNMEQEGSNRRIDEDCEFFVEQIIGIMDFLGYSDTEDAEYEHNIKVSPKEVKEAKFTSEMALELDKRIKKYSNHIISDQLKLYTAYRLGNSNICAVWVNTNSIEIELYINKNNIIDYKDSVYDIANRRRGNRECAIRIKNKNDMEIALRIIKQIIDRV